MHSNFLHWGWTIVLYNSELKIAHRMNARCILPVLSGFYNNQPAENRIIALFWGLIFLFPRLSDYFREGLICFFLVRSVFAQKRDRGKP